MKKSYFYGAIMEQIWMKGYQSPDGFRLCDEFVGIVTSSGYWNDTKRRYEKTLGKKVFFWDVLSVEFEIGWKVRINKEVVIIRDVIHRLDGSIEYHTDKIVSMTTVG